MNIFRKIRASLRLREAVRQADEKHKETGERYYVMPAGGKKGQLIIMDRKNFRKLKQKGYINHNTFVGDLERECFYCTTYGNGSAMLPSAVIALRSPELAATPPPITISFMPVCLVACTSFSINISQMVFCIDAQRSSMLSFVKSVFSAHLSRKV